MPVGLQAKVALEPKEEESKIQQLLQELEKAQKDLDAVRADNQALLKSLEESHCTYTSLRRQLDECRAPQHNEDKNTQVYFSLQHDLMYCVPFHDHNTRIFIVC